MAGIEEGEESLRGGINPIVRIGTTIRRPVGAWSSAVHELLQHLESVGFRGAPRFLGIDEQGREVLSLVPGETPWPPRPTLFHPELLVSSAVLLRVYHDAVAGWTPTVPEWQLPPVATGRPEVICHNDAAPWNLISLGHTAVALVDWDTAAPGPRMWDFAYLAYTLVPLAAPENLTLMGWPASTPVSQRLASVRWAYGCTPSQWDELLTTVPARVQAAYETMRTWAAEDRPGWKAQ
ncbi:aminoglycoside phosphotransferase family protein [Actinopolymorpha alba]|uniref:aminoglycoside phosphotransferase family protein n=1 Tax=Actinopolymorpha alba TaxID=533267 RepID=UPI00036E3238|nr:aminoglycoside phosphotransferase family protein [Actinopolymorpha alba]